MYLDLLNKQEQKDFLELAYHIMGVDGTCDVNEIGIITNYKFECHLADYQPCKQDDLKVVINSLVGSTKKSKKIIIIELLGIVLGNGEMCEKETEFIAMLSNELRIKEFEVARIKRWVEAMNDIFREGYEIISK